MTKEPAAAPDQRHLRSWRRFAGIVVLFALLGPLLGVVIAAPLGLGDVFELLQFGDVHPFKGMAFVVVLGIVMAFAVGWFQGAAIGLVMALWYRRTGTIPLFLAALCGLAALTIPLGLGLPDFGGKEPMRVDTPAEYAVFVAAHVFPSLTCAALARRLLALNSPDGG